MLLLGPRVEGIASRTPQCAVVAAVWTGSPSGQGLQDTEAHCHRASVETEGYCAALRLSCGKWHACKLAHSECRTGLSTQPHPVQSITSMRVPAALVPLACMPAADMFGMIDSPDASTLAALVPAWLISPIDGTQRAWPGP
jgi:hypothetical protein